jgi:hypothetical protein
MGYSPLFCVLSAGIRGNQDIESLMGWLAARAGLKLIPMILMGYGVWAIGASPLYLLRNILELNVNLLQRYLKLGLNRCIVFKEANTL